MPYTMIQPQSFLGSRKEDFYEFLLYLAILFNGTKPFEQIVNTPLTEGPMWKNGKTAQAVSEKMIYKKNIYMYLAQGQGQITPSGQNFDCN